MSTQSADEPSKVTAAQFPGCRKQARVAVEAVAETRCVILAPRADKRNPAILECPFVGIVVIERHDPSDADVQDRVMRGDSIRIIPADRWFGSGVVVSRKILSKALTWSGSCGECRRR